MRLSVVHLGFASHLETVQNTTGQGRIKRNKVKKRIDSEAADSPEKPMKNATPSIGLRGGVQCSQKDSNLRPTD